MYRVPVTGSRALCAWPLRNSLFVTHLDWFTGRWDFMVFRMWNIRGTRNEISLGRITMFSKQKRNRTNGKKAQLHLDGDKMKFLQIHQSEQIWNTVMIHQREATDHLGPPGFPGAGAGGYTAQGVHFRMSSSSAPLTCTVTCLKFKWACLYREHLNAISLSINHSNFKEESRNQRASFSCWLLPLKSTLERL
jgi:hypothetical protein